MAKSRITDLADVDPFHKVNAQISNPETLTKLIAEVADFAVLFDIRKECIINRYLYAITHCGENGDLTVDAAYQQLEALEKLDVSRRQSNAVLAYLRSLLKLRKKQRAYWAKHDREQKKRVTRRKNKRAVQTARRRVSR